MSFGLGDGKIIGDLSKTHLRDRQGHEKDTHTQEDFGCERRREMVGTKGRVG